MKNVFLFFGDNSYLLQQEVKRWQSEFIKKYEGDFNVHVIDGSETSGEEIQSALKSAPFLGDKRLTIIKNFLGEADAKEQEKITNIIEEIPDSTIAVFFEETQPDKRTKLYKKLKDKAVLKEFELMTPLATKQWIEKQAQKYNIRHLPDFAEKLMQQAGADLWTLDNELQKIGSFCKNRAATTTDIETLVQPNVMTSIFKMTDSLSMRDAKQAIDQFHILVHSGEEIRGIFAMIVRHFRILLLLADLKNQGVKSSEFGSHMKKYDPGFHPYVITVASKQVGNFTLNELKKIYERLGNLDVALKTGEIHETTEDKKQILLALEQCILWSTNRSPIPSKT